MLQQKIKGSFGCGGITGYFVDMLEEGYFRTLFDVQCFDLRAVESIGRNLQHREISADLYANPFNRGSVVNMLDCVILGRHRGRRPLQRQRQHGVERATCCTTPADTPTRRPGAKLAIVVAPAIRGRLPIVRDEVTTVTTPGETVDVIVTERGIAVADRHEDLKKELLRRRLPVKDIRQLHARDLRPHGQAAAGRVRGRHRGAHRVSGRIDHRRRAASAVRCL